MFIILFFPLLRGLTPDFWNVDHDQLEFPCGLDCIVFRDLYALSGKENE